MPKNTYFTQGSYTPEKDLLRMLSQEVVSIHGINVNWIVNSYSNVDSLYKEDRLPNLGLAKTIVILPSNATGGVDGDAMYSKFGFLNQQTFSFQIAEKEWKEVFNTHRPLEGDIFYIPGFDEYGPMDFFKVTYVDRENPVGWFPLGKHHVFSVTAEKWAYGSEDFSASGVPEIDSQLPDWSNDVTINPNLEADLGAQNQPIETEGDSYTDWSETNPFGTS